MTEASASAMVAIALLPRIAGAHPGHGNAEGSLAHTLIHATQTLMPVLLAGLLVFAVRLVRNLRSRS